MFDCGTSGTGTLMVPGILSWLVCSSMVLSSSGGGLSVVFGALNAVDGFGRGLFCFPLDVLDLFEDLERVRDLVTGWPG